MRRVGAHCPTKFPLCFRLDACKIALVAIAPSAAHRNQSEGSFEVCCSIVRATLPSRRSPAAVCPPGGKPCAGGPCPVRGGVTALPVDPKLLAIIVLQSISRGSLTI